MRFALLAFAVGAVLCRPALSATFSNGSFEAPVVSPGAHLMTNGNTIGPWVVGSPAGNAVEFVHGTHVGLAPYHGDQYVTFNGYDLAPGGHVLQDFDTVVAATYTVSFAVGRLGNNAGAMGIDANALEGVNVLSFLIAPAPLNGWQTYSFQFTATTTTTRLRFTDVSSVTSSADVALDDIVLSRLTVVPLPQASALAIVGLCILSPRRNRSRVN